MQILSLSDKRLTNFIGKKVFCDKNVNEKVDIFNKTILNILGNFIPDETLICDDRDPPWFNNKIKSLIHEKKCSI